MADATEDDLYAAMDCLPASHDRSQKKLAARHLKENALVLYDLSSSYFEGSHCPLTKLGHSRDGKRGTLQVNYGLLTDERGLPGGGLGARGQYRRQHDVHATQCIDSHPGGAESCADGLVR